MTVDFRGMLRGSAEPDYARFMSGLTPDHDRIMGVRVPRVREIAKAVLKDDWRQALDMEPEFLEEEMLLGIVIASAPVSTKERIALIDGFLPHVTSWATCDIFCSTLRMPKDDPELMWDYLTNLMESGSAYPMRLSLVSRMSIYRDEHHSRMILEDIATHDNPEYYYRMGAAWTVSVVYVSHPDMVEELLRSGRMEVWTHNKSIQKIRESRRVSAGDKDRVRALRRRAP